MESHLNCKSDRLDVVLFDFKMPGCSYFSYPHSHGNGWNLIKHESMAQAITQDICNY